MAQTPATFRQDGDDIDYTPSSAVSGGDVVILSGRVHVATADIAANTKGSLRRRGVVRFPKDSSGFTQHCGAWWNPTGSPVTGTASSGAMSNAATPGYTFAGYVIEGGNAATGASYVDVILPGPRHNNGARSVAATGTVITNAAQIDVGSNWVTAADGNKGVILPTPVLGLDYDVFVKNDDSANAILKVYPPVNGTINALSANTAISLAAKVACVFKPKGDGTGWYTVSLLPS